MFSVACDYLQYAMAIPIICRKCQTITHVNILTCRSLQLHPINYSKQVDKNDVQM